MLIINCYPLSLIGGNIKDIVTVVLVSIVTILTIVSGVDYFAKNISVLKEKKEFDLKAMMTSEFPEVQLEYAKPFMELMMQYRCALMEVETKLNVLNAEFTMKYDFIDVYRDVQKEMWDIRFCSKQDGVIFDVYLGFDGITRRIVVG